MKHKKIKILIAGVIFLISGCAIPFLPSKQELVCEKKEIVFSKVKFVAQFKSDLMTKITMEYTIPSDNNMTMTTKERNQILSLVRYEELINKRAAQAEYINGNTYKVTINISKIDDIDANKLFAMPKSSLSKKNIKKNLEKKQMKCRDQ